MVCSLNAVCRHKRRMPSFSYSTSTCTVATEKKLLGWNGPIEALWRHCQRQNFEIGQGHADNHAQRRLDLHSCSHSEKPRRFQGPDTVNGLSKLAPRAITNSKPSVIGPPRNRIRTGLDACPSRELSQSRPQWPLQRSYNPHSINSFSRLCFATAHAWQIVWPYGNATGALASFWSLGAFLWKGEIL